MTPTVSVSHLFSLFLKFVLGKGRLGTRLHVSNLMIDNGHSGVCFMKRLRLKLNCISTVSMEINSLKKDRQILPKTL